MAQRVLTPDTRRAIRRRFNTRRYSKQYLAAMYRITVEQVDEALLGARRDKLDAIRKSVKVRRSE